MNWLLAITAFIVCFIPFFPLYRYFWRVITQNGAEFAPVFKQEFGADVDESLLSPPTSMANNVAHEFVVASVAVFIVPLIPHCMASVVMYLLLGWLTS